MMLTNRSGRVSNDDEVAQARIASIMSTWNVTARPEMAEIGDEQELGLAIALARKMSMVWDTIS